MLLSRGASKAGSLCKWITSVSVQFRAKILPSFQSYDEERAVWSAAVGRMRVSDAGVWWPWEGMDGCSAAAAADVGWSGRRPWWRLAGPMTGRCRHELGHEWPGTSGEMTSSFIGSQSLLVLQLTRGVSIDAFSPVGEFRFERSPTACMALLSQTYLQPPVLMVTAFRWHSEAPSINMG